MSLQEAAKSYLTDNPTKWVNLAYELGVRISEWLSMQYEIEYGGTIKDELFDIIYTDFLSPQTARLISSCKDQTAAENYLANELYEVIQDRTFESIDNVVDFWDEVVDYSVGDDYQFPVKRLDDLEGDYDESAPLVSPYTRQQVPFDKEEFRSFLKQFINSRLTARELTKSSIHRLDIIDIALYQTIIQHPELLKSLNWRTFEKLLADILESFDYEIELQRGTKDGGVDLFAVKKIDPLGPQRFLLQAKRWSNKVGIEPVRQLAFLHSHHRVTKSCLATTSTFTKGAWELANQYIWQLELRDYSGIYEWIQKVKELKAT